MRLFKCLVPVLILLFVEGSSAAWCSMHRFLIFHYDDSILHRICDLKQEQYDPISAPLTSNGIMNIFHSRSTQQNGNGTAISIGTMNASSSDQRQGPTKYVLSAAADDRSKVNHIPNQGTVPRQSGQPRQWNFVPFQAANAGGEAGPSSFGGSGPVYGNRVPGANSASKADAYAGSSGVDGSGGNAGNTGIISGGSTSSGSGLGGYGGSNGGSFGVNAKADAVATAGATSGSWTDGSDGSSAYRQGSSGGLSSAISNAHSNAFEGSTSSSSKSIR